MTGAPLEALKQGLGILHTTLINNHRHTVQWAIIAYESTAHVLQPLSDLQAIWQPPPLDTGGSSGLGQALRLTLQLLRPDVPTLLYLFTDGEPTDEWELPLAELRKHPSLKYSIGLGCGLHANMTQLRHITDVTYTLHELTPDRLVATFRGLV